jgi:ABC-2 type transport system permease protein
MKALIVAKRLIKQISADKRSIALMFLAPIFVILLLNVILNSSASKPVIDIVSAPQAFIDVLSKDAEIKNVSDEKEALDNLKNGKADAYIVFSDNKPKITIEGSNPTLSGLVMGVIQKSINSIVREKLDMSGLAQSLLKPEINYLYGSESTDMFDSLAPLFMGFFIFFFVFLLAGVSFLRERISGTLERILATPLKRSEIVWGYFLGFGLFVTLQTITIQLFMIYGLNLDMKGNFWLVLFINLILAGQSLALGTLLSSFARNEFQLFQFIPVVIVPQILFSGLFDLRDAPAWVTALSKVFPLTYGAEALKGVMIKGKGIVDIQLSIYILLGYTILFLVLNTLALKKYRKT